MGLESGELVLISIKYQVSSIKYQAQRVIKTGKEQPNNRTIEQTKTVLSI